MSEHQTGPPEREMSAPSQETDTRHSRHHSTDTAQNSPPSGNTRPQPPLDHRSRDRRRRAAENRTQPFACGCRDPWLCDCDTDPFVGDVQADAVIAAAETLLALGTPGIFDADKCRAMWRRGRRDLAASSFRYSSPKEHHDRH